MTICRGISPLIYPERGRARKHRFRKVFAGNVDGIECTSDTYQPFWFWTNGSSECVYKKSLCSEEGQVVQDDGSNEVERGCRCDYRYGYNYVTKPRDICNCFASEEDCSCYRMSCPRGQLLTPDYECRKISEWKHTFGCPDIHVTISPPDEQSTIIVSIVTSKDAEQTASSRIVVRLIALSCLLFIIGLFVLWIFCKQCKQEGNIILKTVFTEIPSEDIPRDIRDLQQNYMEEWQIKDENFVSTRAASEALQSIRKNQCVIITGPLNCGKTFTAQHVILQLMKHDGYGNTPLYLACNACNVDIVELLLSNGASLDVQDKDKQSLLHCSSLTGNID